MLPANLTSSPETRARFEREARTVSSLNHPNIWVLHDVGREGETESPTVAQPLTAEGTIVGTFQYMAPEQHEGKEADARSDLWALGCALYEMATGRRAFEGRSQASLIGSQALVSIAIGTRPRDVRLILDWTAMLGK